MILKSEISFNDNDGLIMQYIVNKSCRFLIMHWLMNLLLDKDTIWYYVVQCNMHTRDLMSCTTVNRIIFCVIAANTIWGEKQPFCIGQEFNLDWWIHSVLQDFISIWYHIVQLLGHNFHEDSFCLLCLVLDLFNLGYRLMDLIRVVSFSKPGYGIFLRISLPRMAGIKKRRARF